MGFSSLGKTTVVKPSPTTSGGFGSLGKPKISPIKSSTVDPSEDLVKRAGEVGLGEEAGDIAAGTPKLSYLQRLSKGLSALNPAEAILTGMEDGFGAGVGKYISGGGKAIASAVTGTDYEGERRTFSDVVEKAGIDNAILKFGLGLAGDILLDPSTYFGGAIAKGIGKGIKIAGSGTLKTVGKVAPKLEAGLRLAGEGAQEALGKGFKYGYGTSEGLAEKSLTIQSKLAKAKEEIVASNIARLGTGVLSKSQQEDLVAKLMAGKRAEFEVGKGTKEGVEAATKAAQSTDPLVQKTIEAQKARSKEFAEIAGLKDPYEVYFPSLKNDNVKKFLENGHQLRIGSEGYLKQFKNLLTDEQLIKNPAEAFAKREYEVIKDSIIKSELDDIVREFGKPAKEFKTIDEAIKAGYQPVFEKGIGIKPRSFFPAETKAGGKVLAMGKLKKPLGYVADVDAKFINDLISPEFTTIDMLAKATGFDAITSLFKRSVTGLFAPFHVRNYLSGQIQNFEVLGIGALNPKNIAAGQKMAYKLSTGDKSLFKGEFGKQMQAFAERFGTSSQYIADIADATKGAGDLPGKLLSKESLKTTAKTLGLGQQAIPFRLARSVGNFIETQQKATAYLTALDQGKTVKEALKLAERAGFDYRVLTKFESKVLRRIIPFYSFTRKNIELQLRTLGENPQRINQVLKTLENTSEIFGGRLTEEEQAGLPDYLKEQITVKTGTTKGGLPEVAAGFQTPIEQPGAILGSNPLRRIFAMLNPLAKAPIERSINLDFFRNRELKTVVEAGEYAKSPQVIKDWLGLKEVEKKNKDGTTRIAYTANPYKLHLLRNLPTSRGANYLGQIFSDEASTGYKWLNAITGFKPRPIDIETVNYFRERDKQRELEDLLIRAGVLKRFEKTYEPKK